MGVDSALSPRPRAAIHAAGQSAQASESAWIDAIPFEAFVVGADHQVRAINRIAADRLGIAVADGVGRPCWQVFHGATGPIAGCPLAEARAGAPVCEREIHDPGSGRWHAVSVQGIGLAAETNVPMYLHIARDVTQERASRQRLEQALEHEVAMVRILAGVERSADSVSLLDSLITELTSISWLRLAPKGAAFILEGEVLRMVAHRALAPENVDACARIRVGECVCGRALAAQATVVSADVDGGHVVRYHGIEPHGHIAVPLVHDGISLGLINLYLPAGHMPDDAQRSFVESAAAVSSVALAARLAEESARRASERTVHNERVLAMGQLAGGIAHDFNNLLTAIIGFSGFALEQVEPNSPVREDLDEIQRAATKAAALTRQLLLFARKEIAEPQVLSLNDALGDMLRLLRRTLGEHIELVAEIANDVPAVKLDPSQLQQIIMNLAVNARDAMPTGGRLLFKTTQERVSALTVRDDQVIQPGTYAVLSVLDTGTGMTSEVLSRVFEPFYTTKARQNGTGMGHATVWGVVERAGGLVTAASVAGTGSTFRVYLPATPDARVRPGHLLSGAYVSGGGETILVAEDDPAIRRLTTRCLERAGYRVLVAADGAAALALAQVTTHPIDLLLTDMVMPGRSGRALAALLSAARPGLGVLYMTGYTDDLIAFEGMADAGVVLLRKPFGAATLLEKVRLVLDATCKPRAPAEMN